MSASTTTTLGTIDDSGLIAVVNASAYSTFVDPDWTYEQLLEHFAAEMAKGTVLVWECGDGGGEYLIEVRKGFTDTQEFRSAVGWLKVNNGALNIASYNALTMAAQFEEYGIPSKQEGEEVFDVPWEAMRVRIVQMYDPSDYEDQPSVHFVLELEPGEAPPLAGVLWETSSGLANHRQEEPAPWPPHKRSGFFSKLLGRS
jgi:hypothetical protein